ncbi:ATP-binding protein [Myxococcota bacterium]|nr:ATP-binding protein [Myxococcota bacterium]
MTAASANAAGGPPFVVELVGLPGAGKSTLVAALLSELAAGGARITGAPRVGAASTRLRRGRALLNALSCEPGAALGALAAGGLDRAALGRVTHFLGRLTQARTLARGPWDLVLLDEGPLQALFTLSALQPATIAGPSVHVARRVAAALPVGRTVLLLVDVDPAEAARRLSQRPVDGARSRFDGLSPAALTPLLLAGAARLAALVSASGLPVVRLSGASLPAGGIGGALSKQHPALASLLTVTAPAGPAVVTTARWSP